MSHRGEQTGAAIRKAVQQVIARGLQDPRVSGLITVTGVNVTGDFAQAVISVSVLPEDREELVLHGLTAGSNYIRREVGELIRTRKLPQFIFKIDRSLKKQAAVLREINRAAEEKRVDAEDSIKPEDDAT
ncbi:MAG: 30S ribosome-binding factor RbfA [Phycisphaerales bacterium]